MRFIMNEFAEIWSVVLMYFISMYVKSIDSEFFFFFEV